MYKFTTNHKYREKEMSDMGDEMKGYFVGPMPATEFLNTFFPKSSLNTSARAKQFEPGCFDDVISCTLETDAYQPFVGPFVVPRVDVNDANFFHISD
jgi:hypothetical protein